MDSKRKYFQNNDKFHVESSATTKQLRVESSCVCPVGGKDQKSAP